MPYNLYTSIAYCNVLRLREGQFFLVKLEDVTQRQGTHVIITHDSDEAL